MDSFTFISLSYNQEEYIVEHLESIRQVVSNYGKKLKINYILADDCSHDKTVQNTRDWLNYNKDIFAHTLLLERNQNIGVVRNMLDAVNHTETKHFKILAADDKFECKDIFSLYEDIGNNLIITPVSTIDIMGNREPRSEKIMEKNFNLICFLKTPQRIRRMIKCENFLPSPGFFFPGDFLRKKEFQRFLLHFRNIEDYPMIYFFLTYERCGVRILNECYVDYRIGSGVSTSKDSEKIKEFQKEIRELYKAIDITLYKYPKYINPYKYYFNFMRIISNIRRNTKKKI